MKKLSLFFVSSFLIILFSFTAFADEVPDSPVEYTEDVITDSSDDSSDVSGSSDNSGSYDPELSDDENCIPSADDPDYMIDVDEDFSDEDLFEYYGIDDYSGDDSGDMLMTNNYYSFPETVDSSSIGGGSFDVDPSITEGDPTSFTTFFTEMLSYVAEFLMTEPMIYFVGMFLLVFVIGIFRKLTYYK